jgi:hypothetical protein
MRHGLQTWKSNFLRFQTGATTIKWIALSKLCPLNAGMEKLLLDLHFPRMSRGFGKRNLADAAPDLTAGAIGSGLAEIPQRRMQSLHRHFRRDACVAKRPNLLIGPAN